MTPPGTSGPDASPGFLLWRTTLRWQREMTSTLKPLALTHVQFVLLASVWWLATEAGQGGQLPSQREVADHAGTDVMMTSQVLRTLEKQGLVTRVADSTDARIKRLAVTRKGAALAESAVAQVEAADAAFFSGVDNKRLLSTLRKLAGWRPR
ncbi:MAG: MarR family winged helix-turn-helix transcriptional regulator [Actinomycetota bacterium]